MEIYLQKHVGIEVFNNQNMLKNEILQNIEEKVEVTFFGIPVYNQKFQGVFLYFLTFLKSCRLFVLIKNEHKNNEKKVKK